MTHILQKKFRIGLRMLRVHSGGIILAGSLALLYLFISIRFWSVVGPILGMTIGAFLAVLWSISSSNRKSSDQFLNDSPHLRIQIPIIVSCSYIITILIGLRDATYQRPTWVYLAFALFAMFIAYQIARGENHTRIIPQIAILAFFTYWSSQLLFPAGMFNFDTHYRYVPAITEIYSTGVIPSGLSIYMGHISHATVFTLVIGKQAQMGYYFLSTLLLVCTIPIISLLNYVMPVVRREIAQYAALIFAISSWMLRRGMHPNKLNYFYALILLLAFISIYLYNTNTRLERWKWAAMGFVVMPAIIFGHRFSAGAALVLLSAIAGFILLAKTPILEYDRVPRGTVLPFIIAYVLGMIGNPIHMGPLLGRISGLILSLFTTTTTGGPGRYSGIVLEVLIASTLVQTILFAIAIFGAVWMFQQEKWEFDLVIFWLTVLSLLIIISLLRNTADTQPQRFYAYLVLFGFNICAAVSLYLIEDRAFLNWYNYSIHGGRILVIVLVASLAITGLASPIASEVMSPVAEDLPHNQKFETEQRIAGDLWSEQYTSNQLYVAPHSYQRPPVQQTSHLTGIVNLTDTERGAIITYSELSNRTGVAASNSFALGGRAFVFVRSPEKAKDNRLYSNGETIAFQPNHKSEAYNT
ncbi:hypothetical protein [Natrinema sp. H-ect4]|uniref:hypothetical protein n=1 Tax=Natrinema sp. H-ect4 TaxID=3242699 RepID=UPI0035A8C0C4